ncbi:MAG: hypothetical protein M3299_11000 [Thermoproteota archaeon]|nr:hypothetical protein [Thermoproteota archaeon]
MGARNKGKRELVVSTYIRQQRRDISLHMCFIFFYYGRKHFPFEALNSGDDARKPLSHAASTSCNGNITTLTSRDLIKKMLIECGLTVSPQYYGIEMRKMARRLILCTGT